MKKGFLVIISGPSGVGKGTVVNLLLKDKSLNLAYSISATTRKARENEHEGIDYFFVSENEFKRMIKEDELLEYAEFVGNYYGTPKKYVESMISQGKNVLLEIETYGAQKVMEKMKGKNIISIFLLPPSIYDLEYRIKNRRTEANEIILERLNKAKKELQLKSLYDYNVINNTPIEAANKISDIIKACMIK